MSLAESMLNSIDETTTEGHIIIGNDRYITVPDELKRLAVQYDHNIETVTFDCPRYWDGIDMSGMHVYINYLRSDRETGAYQADSVSIDGNDSSIMHFDWIISKNVTMAIGKVAFLVCIKKVDSNGNEVNHWNSELYKECYVSEGLEYDGETLQELYPDILEKWYKELTDARNSGEFDGFSPTVSVADISGGHRVTITDAEGPKSFDVMDATVVVDSTDAVSQLLNNFVSIGSEEPPSGPVLWFDTNSTTVVDTDIANAIGGSY